MSSRNACEHEIQDGSPVYVWWEAEPGRFGPRVLMRRGCLECAGAALARKPESLRAFLRQLSGVQPDVARAACPGCGRALVVVRVARSGPLARVPYCSESCARSRATSRSRNACASCGAQFDATRSDARYCSSACRQRAYRLRLATPAPEYPYVWYWHPKPDSPLDRKGERLRVLARGEKNSAAVEFKSDGYRAIVSRNALRRA